MIPSLLSVFTESLGLKLLALFLALIVYAHVYTEQEQESRLRVPLRVTGMPRSLVLDQPPPETVELNARGRGKQLLKLKMQHPELIVDLSGVRPGPVQRMLSPSDVTLPVGTEVSVIEILEPRMIVFSVDTLLEREAEVRATLLGDLHQAYALAGPIRVEPSRVHVRGPSRALESLRVLSTEPLNLGELREAATFELAVRANPEGLEIDPARVRVTVPVVDVLTRTLSPVTVGVEGLAPGQAVRVEPDTAAVIFSGPAPFVSALDAAGLEVRLDLGALGPGRHLVSPSVVPPRPEIRLLGVRPARFVVEILAPPR